MDMTEMAFVVLSLWSLVLVLLAWSLWSRQRERQARQQAEQLLAAQKAGIVALLRDVELLGRSSRKGQLNVRIDESHYAGDYLTIVRIINDSLDITIGVLTEVGDNLNRLSAGDFSAQITTAMVGDYQVLREATNRLGSNLNSLINDSNMMNMAAAKGALEIRIDASKYQGDFSKITNGINGAVDVTVGVLREIGENLNRLSAGDFSAQVTSSMLGDYEVLKKASNQLSVNLMQYAKMKDDQAWIQEGLAQLSSGLTKAEHFQALMQTAISILARYSNAGKGAVYLYDTNSETLSLMGSHAFVTRSALSDKFRLGEGVVGQVALERQPILLRHLSRDDGIIMTATTAEAPLNTYTFPLVYKDTLIGVIELASTEWFDDTKQRFLSLSIDTLSASIFAAQKANETQKLLVQTQQQAEMLEAQAREVEMQNAELEQQKKETERQSRELEVVQQSLQQQNDELLFAQQALQKRAQELAASNKYKGEFLANMTHELRTPLNAINVLAGLLKKNTDQNLTSKQLEHLDVIYYAGSDLLNLINDLLDLSRIEAGQMSVSLENLSPTALAEEIKGMFEPLAQEKGLILDLTQEDNIPRIHNDKAKLRQIVKNFMSNAIKFTAKGGKITLSVTAGKQENYPVEIHVTDTGCGIPEDKLEEIFESFRQVDGSTTRKFGGTGLGLAISKQLAVMLGGEIRVHSQLNVGSIFTLALPAKVPLVNLDKRLVEEVPDSTEMPTAAISKLMDGQHILVPLNTEPPQSKNKKILLIDDDPIFSQIIESQLQALDYQVYCAENGRDGMMMAKKYQPDGILLDRQLPTISGDEVLKLLKRDPQTRHIPVKMISVAEPDLGLRRQGALAVIQKPIEQEQLKGIIDNLLVYPVALTQEIMLLEDDVSLQTAMMDIIHSCLPDVTLSCFHEVESALTHLVQNCPSLVVIDLGLSETESFAFIDRINHLYRDIPIIVYTGRELTQDQLKRLRQYADSVILKTSDSMARLVDEIGLFLHRRTQAITACHERVENLDGQHNPLQGVELLVVDDDVRNLFSLKALLEASGMHVITANHGREALQMLKRYPNTRAVLTDIMMPEMDGYELIEQIRIDPALAQLPVIALTAKVGTDEREKCIRAGADDYLTKPIDEAMLLALLRVWINQTRL